MAGESEKIRTFVAIYPTVEIVDQLRAVQLRLQNDLGANAVRWTSPDQIHLTLQFLGYVKREMLDRFQSALGNVVEETRPFQLRAEGIGCFPSNEHPRIIWAGLAGELNSLQTLKGKLDVVFTEFGYVPEERTFHPHLTIGRVASLKRSKAKWLANEISRFQSIQFGECPVQEIYLMRSVLSSQGAKYHVLNSFPLKAF